MLHAKAIAMMKGPVADRLDDMIKEWYEWLSKMPEHDEFFDSQESIAHVQKLQHSFWMRFFEGNINDDFFESRSRVGQVHARQVAISQVTGFRYASCLYAGGHDTPCRGQQEGQCSPGKPRDADEDRSNCHESILMGKARLVTALWAEPTRLRPIWR